MSTLTWKREKELEREKKKKKKKKTEANFKHENFIAAVRKWEILASTKWKQKKGEQEHLS